jgi:hypothetical protein
MDKFSSEIPNYLTEKRKIFLIEVPRPRGRLPEVEVSFIWCPHVRV